MHLSKPLSLVFLAVLASACSSRPDGVPAPDIGLFAGLSDACPDLRGSYVIDEGEGQLQLPGRVLRDTVRPHRFHSVLAIDSIGEDGLRLSTRATADDLRRAIAHWRHDSDYSYALWARGLQARRSGDGLVLERRRDAGEPGEPAMLRRRNDFRIEPKQYHCEGGWLVLHGEPEPDVSSSRSAEVRLTRARGGGLLARWSFSIEQGLPLWCGDSCKPAIPLPDGHRDAWLHLAPTAEVPETPVTLAELIADDPRPPEVRDRYVEGARMNFATSDQLAAERHARMGLAPREPTATEASDDPAEPGAADPGAAEARWRETATPLLPAGGTIDFIRCKARQCELGGHVDSMVQVSSFLRALDRLPRATPELLLIEMGGDGSYRFQVRLGPEP